MAVILLLFGSVGLGFALIVLIAVFSPRPPPVDLRLESGGSPLVELDAEQLGKVIASILDRMGLEIERWQGGPNEIVEILAVNPTPVTGGRILVHCMVPPDTGKIAGTGVGQFIRSVRTAYVSKGLLFTTGTFTPDGRLEAEDAPVELFDRDQITRLMEQYFRASDPHVVMAASPAQPPYQAPTHP